ncbi:WG repeat-containing protein, partial [Segatella copri]|uniref:WG repeat-containing protein n=1 Tax=Segatella copri TaxID=165179 RepID=UPI0022E7893A
GEIAIKPQYKHAWVFSDGLASVDDNGMIKFIDAKGNVVIDLNIPYITGAEGYIFHNGHCVMHGNKRDKYGLIDKKGKWMLKAEYDAIYPKDSFFIVSKGGMQRVLSENLKVVLPPMEADLWVSDGCITATMKDHTLRKYNLQGQLPKIRNYHPIHD